MAERLVNFIFSFICYTYSLFIILRSKNNVFPNQSNSDTSKSNNERSQQSKGYSMTTVGDIFDKAVDKTLNNKDFMNWAASTRG